MTCVDLAGHWPKPIFFLMVAHTGKTSGDRFNNNTPPK